MNDMIIEAGAKLGMFYVPFLFAICFHEYAHGLVAKWRGDRTAEMAGRLSMNPMAHADPLGTFFLPIVCILVGGGFFFGWANPVPVNERNLKRPLKDMFWIAVAGPASNILLAFVAVFAQQILYRKGLLGNASNQLLDAFLIINVSLAVFNMIPVHPLDGAKVLAPALPRGANRWLEDNQQYLSFGLLALLLIGAPILSIPVLYVVKGLHLVSAILVYSIS